MNNKSSAGNSNKGQTRFGTFIMRMMKTREKKRIYRNISLFWDVFSLILEVPSAHVLLRHATAQLLSTTRKIEQIKHIQLNNDLHQLWEVVKHQIPYGIEFLG